ncbi:MAG: hypothetical protein BMS9Abin36_0917 [Gammaproteobacteria bacterium]|nr:MAG: hypothetical protein BMS9Abin36_0917 [Gammaproteobacteria bacterium]
MAEEETTTMMLAQISAYLGPALLLAWLLSIIYSRRNVNGIRILIVILAAALIVAIPVKGMSVYTYVRGITGDLSIITLILLGDAVVFRLSGKQIIPERSRHLILAAITAAGFILYPTSLGATAFDLYSIGYEAWVLAVALLVSGLAACWRRQYIIIAVVIATISAFNIELLESRNLWDYLIDPFVWIYATAWWVWRAWRRYQLTARAVS